MNSPGAAAQNETSWVDWFYNAKEASIPAIAPLDCNRSGDPIGVYMSCWSHNLAAPFVLSLWNSWIGPFLEVRRIIAWALGVIVTTILIEITKEVYVRSGGDATK